MGSIRPHRRRGPASVLGLLLTVALIAATPGTAWAAAIPIYVNGQQLPLDVPPDVVAGRVPVPVRAIFAALGAALDWDPGTGTWAAWNGWVRRRAG